MLDQVYTYSVGALIAGLIFVHIIRRRFDPFAPVWLFLLGYAQVYVVQPITYRNWAISVRGVDLVTAAGFRALWALVWFLLIYYSGVGPWIARKLRRPPGGWSDGTVALLTPPLILWGVIAAGFVIRFGFMSDSAEGSISAEEQLFRSFPIFMLVAGVLLIVTGRQGARPRPLFTGLGVLVILLYIAMWVFNGKRSPGLFGVLATVCALYVSKGKRPSLPVLAATGVAGVMVVCLAIGWRGARYEQDLGGFSEYLSDFSFDTALVNLNLKGRGESDPSQYVRVSYETEEWGGFLLMLDTVPEKSDYDYGESYLRLYSTYIPRILWQEKPYYGRAQWIHAWMAGSEFPRDEFFTGPAIGLLGATQLNGGAIGTLIVLAVLALLQRTAYEYFRLHEHVPWVQAWWALTYFNAWLMTVNDDPFVWFYYVYGHTILPPLAILWIANRAFGTKRRSNELPDAAGPMRVAI
jgi:hypothetical protein